MPDPQSQNPIITHKLAQLAEFECHASAFEQLANDASTPERAAELQSMAAIAHRQVLQIRAEIAIQERLNTHGEDKQS